MPKAKWNNNGMLNIFYHTIPYQWQYYGLHSRFYYSMMIIMIIRRNNNNLLYSGWLWENHFLWINNYSPITNYRYNYNHYYLWTFMEAICIIWILYYTRHCIAIVAQVEININRHQWYKQLICQSTYHINIVYSQFTHTSDKYNFVDIHIQWSGFHSFICCQSTNRNSFDKTRIHLHQFQIRFSKRT